MDISNLPIVEVLKVGLSGLVFLLAFLAYRLIANEQSKGEPNLRILRNVNVFYWQCILLVFLLAGINIFERISPSPKEKMEQCRHSLLRLEHLATDNAQSRETLRVLIQRHVAECSSILEGKDER